VPLGAIPVTVVLIAFSKDSADMAVIGFEREVKFKTVLSSDNAIGGEHMIFDSFVEISWESRE
jgi:hydrogenase maturation factor